MSEENKPNNDLKSVQDFEMGDTPQKPVINNYQQNSAPQNTTQPPAAPAVNPSAPAPTPAPVPQPAPNSTPPTQTPAPQKPKPNNSKAKKRAYKILLATFGGFLGVFLILAFVFIASSGGSETSPIAKLLGINPASFVNGLIAFVHVIFAIISLFLFSMTMVGLFKASMSKKDDKESRKRGLKMSMVMGTILLTFVIVWGFVYIYLDAKRIPTGAEITAPDIITVPEEPLNLSAPVEVRFDAGNITFNSSKYQIVSHEWDFGDGETGTSQIVAHRYTEKGVFDVKLLINIRDKETGEVSLGGEYHMTVSVSNQALSAAFTADPPFGEAPLEVTLDANRSADPDGNIDTYEWDLDNDGQFDDATGPLIKQEFEKIGKYIVSLRVTSTTGEFDVATQEITVSQPQNPEPVITVVNPSGTFLVNTSYLFKADDSSSPKSTIESYTWDFGDGSRTESSKSASHSFDTAGTYEVKLTIIDEEEKEAEITKTITVGQAQGTPRADISITGQQTGKVPLTIDFDASGSTDSDNNIVEYQWDFDDDGTYDDFGRQVRRTFNSAGQYKVTLNVIDSDGNSDKASIVITAEAQGIQAAVTATPSNGSAPLIVDFDASGSSYPNGQITSYRWDFGDGTASKLGAANITHKYDSIGTYTAKLTAIGSDNNSNTAEITITVRETPIAACFETIFKSGPAPFETIFDPSCSTGTIQRYFWNFGDGGTSTQVKPKHTFEEPGQYTVTLEVSDQDNNLDRFEMQVEAE